MDLSARIAFWREDKRMTVGELAAKCDVTVAAVYQWEGTGKSRTSPSQKHLASLVKALGMTMAEFYGALPKRRAS